MKNLPLIFIVLSFNCSAFELFNRVIVLEAKSCVVEPCIEALYSYSIKNNKIVEKIQLLDNKRKVVRAEIRVLEDCQIIDIKNWNCHASDRRSMFSVVDGVFYPQEVSIKSITWKQLR